MITLRQVMRHVFLFGYFMSRYTKRACVFVVINFKKIWFRAKTVF